MDRAKAGKTMDEMKEVAVPEDPLAAWTLGQPEKPLDERMSLLISAFRAEMTVSALGLARFGGQGEVRETGVWSEDDRFPAERLRSFLSGAAVPDGASAEAVSFGEEAALPAEAVLFPVGQGQRAAGLLFVLKEEGAAWTANEKAFAHCMAAMLALYWEEKDRCALLEFHNSVINAAMAQVRECLYVTDPRTDRILYMNQAMKDLFGLEHPEGEICWKVLQKGMDGRCGFCPVNRLFEKGGLGQVYRWEENNRLTGKIFENSDSLMRWVDGSVAHLQHSLDVTHALYLDEGASRDDLTGLLIRQAGKAALGRSLNRLTAEGRPLVVALLDVNHLKGINDRFGHLEGDRVLRLIAQALREEVREPDFIFRLSGDEFVAVFHSSGRYAVDELLERLSRTVARRADAVGVPCPVSFCFGCFEVAPDHALTISEVLSKADEIMYEQKKRYHIREAARRLKEGVRLPVPPGALDYDALRLYRALTKSTDAYVFVSNVKTGIFRYSPSMVEEFGLPGEIVENAAAVWGSKVHPDDQAAFLEANQIIADGRSDSHCVEYRAKNRKGEWVWVRCRGYLERDERGEPALFAGFITNLGQKNKIDHVTGLFNKIKCAEDVEALLRSRPGHPLQFMVLGLDGFKHINELHNKSFGDEVLRVMAQRIQGLLPAYGSVYRLDGDEFALVVSGLPQEAAEIYRSIAESFRYQQEYDGKKFFCTVSAGSVSYPADASAYAEMVQYASYSLKQAKQQGRNRMVAFSSDILDCQLRSLELVELLRESIERQYEGFEVVYQPQIDAATQRVIGAEALARWTCAKYGGVSPGEFIPLLEQSGLIVPFGKWVFRQAVAQCREWVRLRPDFTVSVNLSYLQVTSGDIVPFMRDTLEKAGLSPSNLVVEFTESCMIQENRRIHEIFDGIRGLGIRIAMDDFGTGYSSLGMLKKSPADIVKIDRTFVRDILKSRFDATFIRFVVALCHDVDIKVCLEGVECEEEFDCVRPMRLDYIQGFFFGRPVAADIFGRDFLSSATATPAS